MADIVIIVDESGSVGAENFEKQREFIKELVERFDVGESEVRIGVVQFSSIVNNQFYLSSSKTKEDVIEYVNSMPYKEGGTQTHKVLSYTYKTMLSERKGARKGVPNIVITLTDGRSTKKQKTIEQAEELKKHAKSFVIGIGSNLDDDEVNAIASGSDYRYDVTDFDVLKGIEDKLLSDMTCQGMGKRNRIIVIGLH